MPHHRHEFNNVPVDCCAAAGEVGIRLEQVQKMLPLLDKLPERVPAEFPIHIGGMQSSVDAMLNMSM